MAEKSSDEIMAEYLLKGARMLSRGCPACGSPLFEIKGETRCVVCAEAHREVPPVMGPVPNPPTGVTTPSTGVSDVAEELSRSLVTLCRKVREESDPERCLILMEAVGEGIEALKRLSQ